MQCLRSCGCRRLGWRSVGRWRTGVSVRGGSCFVPAFAPRTHSGIGHKTLLIIASSPLPCFLYVKTTQSSSEV
eukprot:21644-Eustigmatos_ZCMA.PRE.1